MMYAVDYYFNEVHETLWFEGDKGAAIAFARELEGPGARVIVAETSGECGDEGRIILDIKPSCAAI